MIEHCDNVFGLCSLLNFVKQTRFILRIFNISSLVSWNLDCDASVAISHVHTFADLAKSTSIEHLLYDVPIAQLFSSCQFIETISCANLLEIADADISNCMNRLITADFFSFKLSQNVLIFVLVSLIGLTGRWRRSLLVFAGHQSYIIRWILRLEHHERFLRQIVPRLQQVTQRCYFTVQVFRLLWINWVIRSLIWRLGIGATRHAKVREVLWHALLVIENVGLLNDFVVLCSLNLLISFKFLNRDPF